MKMSLSQKRNSSSTIGYCIACNSFSDGKYLLLIRRCLDRLRWRCLESSIERLRTLESTNGRCRCLQPSTARRRGSESSILDPWTTAVTFTTLQCTDTDERHSIIGAHGNHRYTHRFRHHQVVFNRASISAFLPSNNYVIIETDCFS